MCLRPFCFYSPLKLPPTFVSWLPLFYGYGHCGNTEGYLLGVVGQLLVTIAQRRAIYYTVTVLLVDSSTGIVSFCNTVIKVNLVMRGGVPCANFPTLLFLFAQAPSEAVQSSKSKGFQISWANMLKASRAVNRRKPNNLSV